MALTKDKKKLTKLIQESDSDDSEHELSYYVNDRIKLMKEVLKIIKPKKIKAMAPACLKNLEIEEINSILLEELLGISNKRLKYIFNGQSLEEDSSSSTSEDEPIDIISLDDISDDDLVINIDDDDQGSHRKKKTGKLRKGKKESVKSVKKEDEGQKESVKEKEIGSKKNLMSVLELLELQARARAIKSQLLLENAKTQENIALTKKATLEEKVGSDDEVIIKTAKTEEIVITSSDEDENNKLKNEAKENTVEPENSNNIGNDPKVAIPDVPNLEPESENPQIIENTDPPSNQMIVDVEQEKIDISEKQNEVNDSQVIVGDEKKIEVKEKPKIADNDEVIQINLSDDEMDAMK